MKLVTLVELVMLVILEKLVIQEKMEILVKMVILVKLVILVNLAIMVKLENVFIELHSQYFQYSDDNWPNQERKKRFLNKCFNIRAQKTQF